MARRRCILRVAIDDADISAYRRSLDEHFRRYGSEPAPHLRSAAKRDLDRIKSVFRQCIDFVAAPRS